MKTYVHLWQYLAEFFLEWDIFQTYVLAKAKAKFVLEGPVGEYRYSSTLSLTSVLDGGCLSPRKETRYPLYRRLDQPQNRCGRVRKISSLRGIRSPNRPARSEALYRLRYPGPDISCIENQNTHFMFNKLFFFRKFNRKMEKYDTAWEVTVYNITRRMRFVCWITKATHTYSEYVIRIVFLRQQWLRKRASMLRLHLHSLSCLLADYVLLCSLIQCSAAYYHG